MDHTSKLGPAPLITKKNVDVCTPAIYGEAAHPEFLSSVCRIAADADIFLAPFRQSALKRFISGSCLGKLNNLVSDRNVKLQRKRPTRNTKSVPESHNVANHFRGCLFWGLSFPWLCAILFLSFPLR